MSKVDTKGFRFLFDDKIFLSLSKYNDFLYLCYQIDDYYCFLIFFTKTKKFEKEYGFGKDKIYKYPNWWEDRFYYEWKEI